MLRIIAGQFKGRRIEVPRSPDVRPTTDRVREALFSILGDAVEGAGVLDLYSGSGALGFEALSRGAASLVFVEADRAVLRVLRHNAARLGVEGHCRFVQARALEALRGGRVGGVFTFILADPPYRTADVDSLLALAAPRLGPDGLLVLERDSRTETPSGEGSGLELTRRARYGDSTLLFYARTEQDGASPGPPGRQNRGS